jgi:hypothetical protein
MGYYSERETTLGKLIAELQEVEAEHGPNTSVTFDGYQGEYLVVRTTNKGRSRADSGTTLPMRVVLDIRQ